MTPLAELLARFDARTDSFSEIELHGGLKALPEGESPTEEEHTRWEVMAFLFAEDYPENGTGWGTYFGPMAVLPGADGTVLERPSIKDVAPVTLAYWLQRAKDAKHPLLRMRYADLVWDLTPRVPSAKRDASAAHIAIDAALDLAARADTEDMIGRAKLTRALQLAKAIKYGDRTTRVRDAMIDFEERTAKDDLAGTWGYCFDELIEAKEQLASGQEQRIIAALEARLGRVVGEDGTAGGDPFSARDIAVRLARYYRRTNSKENLRRVLRASADVFERLSKQAMPLLGAEWMRGVYDTYREFGLNDEADALNPMLADLGSRSEQNLRRVTHGVEIPREHFDHVEQAVAGGTLDESLGRVARLFLVDPDHAEQEVQRLAREFPIQGLFRQVYVDAHGRVESEVGGVQEDLRGRVIVQMARSLGLASVFLRHALDTVSSRFSARAEDLADTLCLSPVFRAEQRPFVLRAMRAFIEEDWMSCIHVLVPQIENSIRTLVILRGGSHLKPHRQGGMVYRPLDDLLRDPTVGEVLGDKVVHYLQVVLTDQRGLNLRNEVCHGYGTVEMFGPQVADRLVHVALVLGQLRSQGPQPPSGPE